MLSEALSLHVPSRLNEKRETRNELLADVFPIRCPDNPVQLAVVQPVEVTVLAVVDDDVAAAAVKVRVHLTPAFGAGKPSIEISRVEWTRVVSAARPARLQVFNHRRENAHRNQHAVT